MILGFTGSRYGLSSRQIIELGLYLTENRDKIEYAHHGCCIGGDAQFHAECRELGILIIGHPPIKSNYRAAISPSDFHSICEPKNYLERNRDIVECCDMLFGCPKSMPQRGGTWFTINYARSHQKPVILIKP